MATTAWKFSGTETADEAVLRLKDLDAKEYIDVLSTDAAIDTVAGALQGLGMELTRSDLSVQQQDHVRAAFSDSAAGHQDRPGPPT